MAASLKASDTRALLTTGWLVIYFSASAASSSVRLVFNNTLAKFVTELKPGVE
ncbi:hypothetical protein C427_4498 [Paraglaciecola psychrophila 170]|uniref:Uncharacterized protein n=1 Tax=Paraglaciecola psychrophila 170 TaxID=1129794 RepID=K7A8K1_9ALTE|nr:hypothetical protein C427_4498 [Paraglaciecola psychrophila 170]GAC37093.1 hypothetical protein GPSY_1458 [Paraglaciecola psychrophila 170]